MEQFNGQTKVSNTNPGSHIVQRVIGALFGIIELILVLRLVFKLLGASSTNVLVQGLYDFTQPFVGIFENIFAQKSISTAETVGTFEPETLIEMVVVALVAMIVLKIIEPRAR